MMPSAAYLRPIPQLHSADSSSSAAEQSTVSQDRPVRHEPRHQLVHLDGILTAVLRIPTDASCT
jgi:hypothetical protein